MTFRRSKHRWGIALVVTALPSIVQAQDASMKEAYQKVSVGIEVSRPSYRAGDSISVRLTLHNTGNRTVLYPAIAAPHLVHLSVHDGGGREVRPLRGKGAAVALSVIQLSPGAELTLTSSQGKEWVNLRDWGFELRTPGKYRIVGTPSGGPSNVQREAKAARSCNEASLTIIP
jgi:hypothetical protein